MPISIEKLLLCIQYNVLQYKVSNWCFLSKINNRKCILLSFLKSQFRGQSLLHVHRQFLHSFIYKKASSTTVPLRRLVLFLLQKHYVYQGCLLHMTFFRNCSLIVLLFFFVDCVKTLTNLLCKSALFFVAFLNIVPFSNKEKKC